MQVCRKESSLLVKEMRDILEISKNYMGLEWKYFREITQKIMSTLEASDNEDRRINSCDSDVLLGSKSSINELQKQQSIKNYINPCPTIMKQKTKSCRSSSKANIIKRNIARASTTKVRKAIAVQHFLNYAENEKEIESILKSSYESVKYEDLLYPKVEQERLVLLNRALKKNQTDKING